MVLKILSWNICRGQKRDQIIRGIAESGADIICLQEVIKRENYNLTEDLASNLKLNYCVCLVFHDDRHEAPPSYELGNAILTKFPITQKKCHSLLDMSLYKKNSETEPRGVSEAEVSVSGKTLKVFSTHLAYSNDFKHSNMRKFQRGNLLKIMPSTGVILAGDFNCLPDSDTVKEMETHFQNCGHDSIEPTTIDNRRIDYIFVSNDIKVKSFEVLQKEGSDHFPILAELSLDKLN